MTRDIVDMVGGMQGWTTIDEISDTILKAMHYREFNNFCVGTMANILYLLMIMFGCGFAHRISPIPSGTTMKAFREKAKKSN